MPQPATSETQSSAKVALSGQTLTLGSINLKLMKHGDNTLTYNTNGQLIKVSEISGNYTQYTYPDVNTIIAMRFENGYYYENGIKTPIFYNSHKTTYTLSQGKAIASKETRYTPGIPNHTHNYYYTYFYDSYGRLEYSRVMTNHTGINQAFDYYSYGTDGNLRKMTTFYLLPTPYWKEYSAQYENRYTYQTSSATSLPDNYPLNPVAVAGSQYTMKRLDPYLCIFGTFNQHLLEHYTAEEYTDQSGKQKQLLHDYSYEYTLNADQYVTERKTLDAAKGGKLLSTITYTYFAQPISN